MDSPGRRPGALAKVPGMSGGLHCDWDRDRTFGVNRDIFADATREPVCGVARIPGGQTGVARSPIRS
jgi:hypothetical protein